MDSENLRERIELQKRAKFTLKDEERGWENCTLLNLNQNLKGLGIRFHTLKDIKVNSIVIIDLSHAAEGESFSIVGIVRWIYKVEDDLMGGIELIGNINKLRKILPEVSFSRRAKTQYCL
jgi:hypothetical protein